MKSMRHNYPILMNEHPVKAVIATIAGTYYGGTYLLQTNPVITGMDQGFILAIALLKACALGGAAWTGQAMAQWVKRKAVARWKEFRNKK